MFVKEDKFLVINRKRFSELNKYRGVEKEFSDHPAVERLINAVENFVKRYEKETGKKTNQKYIVVNEDEPYADAIWHIIEHRKPITQKQLDARDNYISALECEYPEDELNKLRQAIDEADAEAKGE